VGKTGRLAQGTAQEKEARNAEERQAMIYRRGKRGTYWIRFRFAGRFVHESARTTSRTVAREAERQRRRELERSWNRIQKRTGLARNTRETYEGALKHLREILGTMLVSEIEARNIVAYQKARLAQCAAGATINKEIACLSSILSDCGV
jgi:hypothetical protein